MTTKAQTCPNRRNELKSTGPQTTKKELRKIHSFIQNEPNFQKSQMNLTSFNTARYAKLDTWSDGTNKPKQTQSKPIQSQFLYQKTHSFFIMPQSRERITIFGKDTEMQRNAFKMKLKPGFEAEYKKRHDDIWPQLKKEISNSGVFDYSIYLDEETLTLFAVQKLKENNTADQLRNNPVVRKWWDYMADIMEYNPDNTPVSLPLKEVFHMD